MGSRALVVLVFLVCPATPYAQCGPFDLAAAESAAALIAEGALEQADATLRAAAETSRGCHELAVAAISLGGWRAAREASATGGTPDRLAPAAAAIDRLAVLGPSVSPAGYALAAVRAAAAASQDERDELGLWLDHARDISERLEAGTSAPRWPSPIGEVEGTLWLEVDDFELAEAAFLRALEVRNAAASWAGLARARDRRGKREEACDAYRHALAALVADLGGALAREATGYLLACAQ